MRARTLATMAAVALLVGGAGDLASATVPGSPAIRSVSTPRSVEVRDTTRGGNRGSRSDDAQPEARPPTFPDRHRTPQGSPPWMPVALVLAFLATAVGLKRLS